MVYITQELVCSQSVNIEGILKDYGDFKVQNVFNWGVKC